MRDARREARAALAIEHPERGLFVVAAIADDEDDLFARTLTVADDVLESLRFAD